MIAEGESISPQFFAIGDFLTIDTPLKSTWEVLFIIRLIEGLRIDDATVKVEITILHSERGVQFLEDQLQALKYLNNAHIIQLLDFGKIDERLFIVTKWLGGGTLLDCLQNGPIELSEAVIIFQQISDALDYSHAKNIFHGAVRPWNVSFDEAGNAYLCNFGLSEWHEFYLSEADIPYMSPAFKVGKMKDIFALSVLFYEMLTSEVPITTPMGNLNAAHIRTNLSKQPDLPHEFVNVIETALIADAPDEYFQTVWELSSTILSALNSSRIMLELSISPYVFPLFASNSRNIFILDKNVTIQALSLTTQSDVKLLWGKTLEHNNKSITPISVKSYRGKLLWLRKKV